MSTNQNYIHWHTAFQAAAELELRENIEELTFEPEHYLSKEPLRIDLLILHLKNHTTHLHNEIGKIMRKHNIIEYKGPVFCFLCRLLYYTDSIRYYTACSVYYPKRLKPQQFRSSSKVQKE